MTISRRRLLATAAGASLATGLTSGCSIISRPKKSDDKTLRINYGGASDVTEIPKTNPIQEALKAKLGWDVSIERSPEDMGAALAGGQAPDIFLSSMSQLRQFADQDLLLDLTPYRERLKDYEAFVGSDTLDGGKIGDKLYGIMRKPREFNYGALWIRNDWLKKLGLSMPKTTDDLLEAMTAFHAKDPDGNGKNNTVGLTGAGLSAFGPIFGAYGLGGPDALYAHGKKVTIGYTDPAVMKPLRFINSLFSKGLVDPDLFSLETEEARDRAFQGSAGAVMLGWDQMTKPEFVKAQKAAQPDADWKMIDVLSSDGVKGGMPTSPFGAVQGIPAKLADDEERLNALIDYLNYISTPEGSRLVLFGVEGKHFELKGDKVKALPALDEDGSYFFAYQVAGRDEDVYLDVKFPKQRDYWEACRDRKRIVQYDSLVAPPEGFKTADASRFGEEQLALFLTGERKLDTYPKFKADLNKQFDYAGYVKGATEQLAALGLPE